jgi:hypothetical protein
MSEKDETNIDIDIDAAQIAEHIEAYREAADPEERRQIENAVLAETVWKTDPRLREDKLVLDEPDVDVLSSALPDDAEEAQRILRSFYVQRL